MYIFTAFGQKSQIKPCSGFPAVHLLVFRPFLCKGNAKNQNSSKRKDCDESSFVDVTPPKKNAFGTKDWKTCHVPQLATQEPSRPREEANCFQKVNKKVHCRKADKKNFEKINGKPFSFIGLEFGFL